MTRYRVSATLRGKRMVTDKYWGSKTDAQKYADETNTFKSGFNARVVKDSERVRRMIP
jgi:hypothetical protein